MSSSSFEAVFLGTLGDLGGSADREVVVHSRVDSTSSDLIRRLGAGSLPGTVVVAGEQTAGRGRRGRSWHSGGGADLCFSLAVLVREPFNVQVGRLPLAAGIAIFDALEKVGCTGHTLKWPNDVLVSGKKIAGTLCEIPNPTARPVVAAVGLGVNIASTGFPSEISDVATSLSLLGMHLEGAPVLPSVLAAFFTFRLEQLISGGEALGAEIVEEWKKRAEPFGRRVRVDGEEGQLIDIRDDGHLVLKSSRGEIVDIVGGVVEYLE